MLPSLARFNQSRSSRSCWLIAIRSILQSCGCQEELSTWLKAELFTWPRQHLFPSQTNAPICDRLPPQIAVTSKRGKGERGKFHVEIGDHLLAVGCVSL